MIYKPALFVAQTTTIVLVALIHISALQFYLYWYYPWLDVFSHFLGGMWVALASAWLLSYAGYSVRILHIIVSISVVGISWEIFELAIGFSPEANFMFDTSLDLLMDFLGSVCGFVTASYLLRDRISAE